MTVLRAAFSGLSVECEFLQMRTNEPSCASHCMSLPVRRKNMERSSSSFCPYFMVSWTLWIHDTWPDHLFTCLLRNLYAGQEATVRMGHGTKDWFQIGKGVPQGCILSPWLFNSCAEYAIQNARLDEAQAGIKIARRNINNLRYADGTTLMVQSGVTKEPLDESEREEWKSWLKAQHSEY